MDRTTAPPFDYSKEYFFEMYQKNYGKTYIEDFPNIKASSRYKIQNIKSLMGKSTGKPSLLEIGCAYGPHLAAARDEGFIPMGIEPTKDAVKYAREELGIEIVEGLFPQTSITVSKPFDVVTLWLAIEHIPDCARALAEINKLLKPGGILAISTPSYSGMLGRKSIKSFLKQSPADHFTIWSPKMCKKALALHGFKVKKIFAQANHPERFPLIGKFIKSRKNPLFWIYYVLCKAFALSDVFEIYAIKAGGGE